MTWNGRPNPSKRQLRATHWTGRELAEVLGCNPRTVWQLGRTGALPAIRLGGPRGPWRYPRDAIRAALSRGLLRLPSRTD